MKIAAIVVTLVFFLTHAAGADAKLLPRAKSAPAAASAPARSTGGNVGISPKFMSGKTGLRVTFTNLGAANSVSYTLSYETNGKPEGVVGSVNVTKGTETRDLLFGTCSSGVCKYHKGITNMSLSVKSALKSGKQSTRRYRIRV